MNKSLFLISLMRMADGQVFNSEQRARDLDEAVRNTIKATDPSIAGATRDAFTVLLACSCGEYNDVRRVDSYVIPSALNSGAKWV